MTHLVRLAQHPAATPALLAALTGALPQGPLSDSSALRCALLSHPNTPTGALNFLLGLTQGPADWTPAALLAVAARPGSPMHPLIGQVLTSPAYREHTIQALIDAPTGCIDALIAHVTQDRATRHTIVPALLAAPALTPAQARILAGTLAHDPQPQPAARTWLMSLIEQRCLDIAPALTLELTSVTSDDTVRRDLADASHRAHQRTYLSTLIAAGVSVDERPGAWQAALRAHSDTDGTLSRAALARAGHDPDLLAAIVADPCIPLATRRDAAVKLRTHHDGDPTGVSTWATYEWALPRLLSGAPDTFVRAVAADPRTWPEAAAVLSVAELTAEDLTTVWRTTRMRDLSGFGTSMLEVCARFASHPNAPTAVRHAAANAAAHLTTPTAATDKWRALLDASAPTTDPVRMGGALPVAALTWPTNDLPGLTHALDATLGVHLPNVNDPAHAAALIHLVDGFTGSIEDLFDVARTVATP